MVAGGEDFKFESKNRDFDFMVNVITLSSKTAGLHFCFVLFTACAGVPAYLCGNHALTIVLNAGC